jgi:hypothetical protein
MHPKTIAAIGREFAELDFTVENAEIEQLEADIVEIDAARAKADERCREIVETLRHSPEPSGRQVASALIAGVSVSAAAAAGPTSADLEAEKTALRGGIAELAQRSEEARRRIDQVQVKARARLAPAAQRMVAIVEAEAIDLAERLLTTFAALDAIAIGTKFGTIEAAKTKRAADAAMRGQALLPFRLDIAVPTEITDALRNLEGKGKALPAWFRTVSNV